MLFLSYLILAGGLLFSAALLTLGLKLLRADRMEGKKSALRAPSVLDAILGRSRMTEDWIPDGRVKGGMVYNHKENRLEISGRLSTDSLDRVFRQNTY